MADNEISNLQALTTPASGDLLAIVDDPSGSAATKKVTFANFEGALDHGNLTGLSTGADHSYIDQDVTSGSAPTFTATNITDFSAGVIDAITEIDASLKSGSDITLITGTKGTNGNVAQWNADGDLVDGTVADTNLLDKTATETVSGDYTFSGDNTVSGSMDYGDSMPSTNVRCSVYGSSDQDNLTDSTQTDVAFDTEEFDSGNDWDTTNYEFTCPVTGYYLVACTLRINASVANEQYKMFILTDSGGGYDFQGGHAWIYAASAGFQTLQDATVMYRSSGDKIKFVCISESGDNDTNIEHGIQKSRASIHLLST